MKKNDVYRFRYNEEETRTRFEPYHCFDGTLIVREFEGGRLILEDTYWSSENRIFTPEEAQKQGYLTFICNLNEVDKANERDAQYYSDDDFIELYIHHGYRNQYFLKRGAQRSKDKMIQSIKQKIEEAEYKKRSAERDIEWHNQTLLKIEAGDTTVHL